MTHEIEEGVMATAAMKAQAKCIDDGVQFASISFDLGFTAGYQSALPKWIPIADIPDEWKDGRGLLLLSYGLVTLGKWDKCSVSQKLKFMGYSINENGSYYWTSNNITHAMLPPSPPKVNES